MVKVLGQYRIRTFEYLYMFVMVIYMAQMTKATGRMIGSLTGDPIPFLIPIVLTVILLFRNKVNFFNKYLGLVLSVATVWSVCIIIKLQLFSTQELSYIFFLYYAIIIAFIHCQVFGRKLPYIYEDIMVVFAKICFPLWLFGILLPFAAAPLFHLFPKAAFGYNFLYLFQWTEGHFQNYALLRNAGCSWEPGRFSIMVALAICFNLLRNGVKFRNNRNIIWLLLVMLSTQSTTGYSVTILLYLLFYIRRVSVGYIVGFFFVLVPIVFGVMQFDFMAEKIQDRLSFTKELDEIESNFDYHEQEKGAKGRSLDRFISLYYEFQNVIEDPILGYSRNPRYSYFRNNVSSIHGLTGGTLKVLGQYGIPFGLFLFYILYRSSVTISDESNVKRRMALFFTIIMSAISYAIFTIPVFTAFWFYGFFKKNEGVHHREISVP